MLGNLGAKQNSNFIYILYFELLPLSKKRSRAIMYSQACNCTMLTKCFIFHTKNQTRTLSKWSAF